MKAAQFKSYGGPEVIIVDANAQTPALKPGQIMVENHAASINPFDGFLRSGGMQKSVSPPMPITTGGDFAGVVTAIGEGVTEFKSGDEVYGQAIVLNGGSGTFAEIVAANTKNTAHIPKLIDLPTAAALPLAGTSAVQAIEELIKIESREAILIHGGAGGIGHIAIQLAKSMGAFVTTTVSADDIEFVRGLGADKAIDYKSQKFEEILKGYDAVFDTVGGDTTEKSFLVLKRGGTLVSMKGPPNPELAKKYSINAISQNTKTTTERLTRLAELVDLNKFKIHIDRIFPLDQAREAFIHQETGHPRGKVIVTI